MKHNNLYADRQNRLQALLSEMNLDVLAVNPGPSLVYLTGLHFHLMERPVVALFQPQGAPILILPALEKAKTAQLSFPLTTCEYDDNPLTWNDAFRQAVSSLPLHATVGVEPTRLRYLEMQFLQKAAHEARFISAETVLETLRIQKDAAEISSMRKAVTIAQQGLLATLPEIRAGVTERRIANLLTVNLLYAGSEPEMPFAPIVSGGPNSANPHATPTDRPLQDGDLLVIDWGATADGYIADLTRTFAIGDVQPEYRHIAAVVQAANTAGRSAAKPGASAEDVDAAARDVIRAAGYGEFFIHRTGHGIGLEGHEAPYIRQGNLQALSKGMAFTVEPGIYLPGRNGVRIEDNLVITDTGADCLSDLPRELIQR